MDRGELYNDRTEALRAALEGWQARMYTALPGIIQSYDAVAQTVSVQPALRAQVRAADGTVRDVDLPLCLDCPVQFPGGGGFVATFPVAPGDECLLVFSARCIDAWWQSGGIQSAALDLRMHDLSDGFAILGFRSQPRRLASVSTTAAELRTDDGAAFVRVAAGAVTLRAGSQELVLGATGLRHNGVNIGATHTHSGVQSGAANTGVPNT